MKVQHQTNLNATAPTLAWDEVPFDDAFNDVTSLASKIPQEEFLIRGKFPVIDQGDGFIAGYSNEESALWPDTLPVIIFGDHTRALKYVDFRFILGADGCKVLRPSDRIHPKFGYYHLKHLNISEAGYSRHFKFLKETSVRFPSLPEQRQIAQRLEQADRLRRTRRYALQLTDSFLPAAFLKLFGNRFNDGKFLRFGDLVKITGGGTPSRENPAYFHGRIPWLTSKDMRDDYIWDTEEHITEEAIENSSTYLIPANSILVVVKSKVLMHRLPVAIAKVPMCHGQDVKSIQCNEEFHHEFARFVLKHHEARLLNIARGANTEGLTLPMLHELPVPKVDPVEQQKFAALVHRTDRLRAAQREALRQADHLFASLLHQAFCPD